MKHLSLPIALLITLLLLFTVSGCDGTSWDWASMNDQPHYKPYDASNVLPDGTSSQSPPAGTIPRNAGLNFQQSQPQAIDMVLLKRGQQRFNIYCATCHGEDGYGQGMVVRRGFPQPPSLHEIRLRNADDRYLYNVITQGRGKMASYAYELSPADRQAVIAYIRALQLSQQATPDMVPASNQSQLQQSDSQATTDPANPRSINTDQRAIPHADPTPASVPQQEGHP